MLNSFDPGLIWVQTVYKSYQHTSLAAASTIVDRTGHEFIKLFSCSTQLSTKFQLLIETKIPTNKKILA